MTEARAFRRFDLRKKQRNARTRVPSKQGTKQSFGEGRYALKNARFAETKNTRRKIGQ